MSVPTVSKTNKKKSKAPQILKHIDSDNSQKGLDEVNEGIQEDNTSVFKNKLIRDMQDMHSDSQKKLMESSDN